MLAPAFSTKVSGTQKFIIEENTGGQSELWPQDINQCCMVKFIGFIANHSYNFQILKIAGIVELNSKIV
jgi:primosomal replication protein N